MLRPVIVAAVGTALAAAVALAGIPAAAAERPPLPVRPDGHGVAQPTPPDLVDRRLPTRDGLPPPADGRFVSTVAQVPDDVLARSTWKPECPRIGPTCATSPSPSTASTGPRTPVS